MNRLFLCLPLLLAACATPYDAAIKTAEADYRAGRLSARDYYDMRGNFEARRAEFKQQRAQNFATAFAAGMANNQAFQQQQFQQQQIQQQTAAYNERTRVLAQPVDVNVQGTIGVRRY